MSTTLGPMVPSLMGSSICLLLTVSVPLLAPMDTSNATGDPIRDDSRRKLPDQRARTFCVRSTRYVRVCEGRVHSDDHDGSILTATLGRACGGSPRRKRSMTTSCPPRQGQASAGASPLAAGSGSAWLRGGAESRLRIREMLTARVPLANRP